jgi:S-DNA-T family DNA segregation ATPase FtsK/SpoIIIE
MSPSRRRKSIDFSDILDELRESVSRELMGMIVLVLGAGALFSLFAANGTPWLTHMMGWTAPWFALAVIIFGAVLMLGERAGYWSAEALLGAELLLLSLQAGSFVANNTTVAWQPPIDGADGGVIGWAVGSLLMSTLGRWPTALLLLIMGGIGLALLLLYTPAVYAVHWIGRMIPVLPALWADLRENLPWPRDESAALDDALPMTANFVPAVESPVFEERDTEDAPIRYVAPVGASDPAPPPTGKQKKRKPPATKTSSRKKTSRPLRTPDDLPPMDLLKADSGTYAETDVRALSQLIESTLYDFNTPVRVVHVESGPTVTQFGLEPLYLERAGKKRKVRVNRIVSLADDLALALAAPSVRIEAPVPGQPYVGIEVPNPKKTLVSLRGIMESPEMRKTSGDLLLPLGRDTAGRPIITVLDRAPHILIAGQTGSGKSVCINTIITGLLMRHGPESLRFVMVDPKMVELPGYNGIPHLLGKVITDMDQVMGALTWLLLQMDDRYQLFRAAGVRNIDAYNALARRRKSMEPLPYIVLIVDELADLMMTAADDVERQITRLAQLARATGVHLILATQRPSTDVVTGLIKANFPTRIAFAVTSQIDSRVILDQPGAERLLGRGDMLLMRPDASKLFRVQGCFVGDDEIDQIVHFWKNEESSGGGGLLVPPWNSLMDRMEDQDELLLDAIDILRDMDACSTSMLQRKLRVGYPKAARIMEQLEAQGVVGPDMGGGQGRKVLLKKDEEEDEDM